MKSLSARILRPEDFIEGKHWRRFSKQERQSNNDHGLKAVLLMDVFFQTQCPVLETYRLSHSEKEWARIMPDGILVKANYAWDLCTYSPDIEPCGSLPHDVLFQFSCPLQYYAHRVTCSWATKVFKDFAKSWAKPIYVTGLSLFAWTLWGKYHGGSVEIILPDYKL